MFAKTFLTAILAATSALAQQFTINSPAALIECQPAALSWTGGTPPYILAVIPGGEPSAAALVTLADNTQSTSYTWNVNLARGTSVTIRLTDSTGNIAYSSPVTIQPGSSQSCLNATATSYVGGGGVVGPAFTSTTSGASAASSAASGVSSASAPAGSVALGAASGTRIATMSAGSGPSTTAVSSAGGGSSASTPVASVGGGPSTSPSSAAYQIVAAPGAILAALGGILALL